MRWVGYGRDTKFVIKPKGMTHLWDLGRDEEIIKLKTEGVDWIQLALDVVQCQASNYRQCWLAEMVSNVFSVYLLRKIHFMAE
jgi:hypothetical protein